MFVIVLSLVVFYIDCSQGHNKIEYEELGKDVANLYLKVLGNRTFQLNDMLKLFVDKLLAHDNSAGLTLNFQKDVLFRVDLKFLITVTDYTGQQQNGTTQVKLQCPKKSEKCQRPKCTLNFPKPYVLSVERKIINDLFCESDDLDFEDIPEILNNVRYSGSFKNASQHMHQMMDAIELGPECIEAMTDKARPQQPNSPSNFRWLKDQIYVQKHCGNIEIGKIEDQLKKLDVATF